MQGPILQVYLERGGNDNDHETDEEQVLRGRENEQQAWMWQSQPYKKRKPRQESPGVSGFGHSWSGVRNMPRQLRKRLVGSRGANEISELSWLLSALGGHFKVKSATLCTVDFSQWVQR